MPDVSVNQGHLDRLLTDVSVAYMQGDEVFIADKVFPLAPVAKASDFYLIYDRSYFYRDDVSVRPMGDESNVTGLHLSKGTYFCEELTVAAYIDDRERANATPPYDPERAKTKLLTQKQLIHRDAVWASSYFTTGKWGTDKTGVGSAPGGGQFLQLDLATQNPIEFFDSEIDLMQAATGIRPNRLVLGPSVYRGLKNHPVIKDVIKYTQRGIVTTDILASVFEVDRVLVPRAVQNTVGELSTGNNETNAFIATADAALLCYAADSPGIETPTAGYTFAWTGLLGGDAFSPGAIYKEYIGRRHSTFLESRMSYDMEIVASDLGRFYASAVSASA